MARHKDSAEIQAAKGNPGKRMTKAERAIAESARRAALLADAPAAPGGALAPPMLLADSRMQDAIAVWRELAPQLERMNVLTNVDRHTFAAYCVSVADYYAAVDDVMTNGAYYWATLGHGNRVRRRNPAADDRDRLGKFIFDAGAHFGLSPMTRYSLMREQAAYGGSAPPPSAPQHEAQPADDEDLIGLAARQSSPTLQ